MLLLQAEPHDNSPADTQSEIGGPYIGRKKKNTCSLISPDLNNTVGVSIIDSREPRGETVGKENGPRSGWKEQVVNFSVHQTFIGFLAGINSPLGGRWRREERGEVRNIASPRGIFVDPCRGGSAESGGQLQNGRDQNKINRLQYQHAPAPPLSMAFINTVAGFPLPCFYMHFGASRLKRVVETPICEEKSNSRGRFYVCLCGGGNGGAEGAAAPLNITITNVRFGNFYILNSWLHIYEKYVFKNVEF